MIIYGYCLLQGANLLSDGSEMLLEILDPGLIGGVLCCLLRMQHLIWSSPCSGEQTAIRLKAVPPVHRTHPICNLWQLCYLRAAAVKTVRIMCRACAARAGGSARRPYHRGLRTGRHSS